jgi:hypothetical protein
LDPCCDGSRCRLQSGAQCSATNPCCSKCRVIGKFPKKVCRPTRGNCDLEDFCSGESAYCGLDAFLPPGEICLSPSTAAPGKCYDGNCMTRATMCENYGLDQPCTTSDDCGQLRCIINGVCSLIRSKEGGFVTIDSGVPCSSPPGDRNQQCLDGNCVESSRLL